MQLRLRLLIPLHVAAPHALQGFSELEENWSPTKGNDAEWRERRLPAFKAWLHAQGDEHIAVIGHGAFFAPLLGKHLRNCEVAELSLG